MQGKTVVVTGGTSGIGEVAALCLAEKGARIVLIARDRTRAIATLAKINGANPSADHQVHYADLSSLADMRRVAREIADRLARIDVLVNNAGAVFLSRKTSVDGLEMTFATNHMSYFVVTNILLDRLKTTPGARIVSTASDAHRSGKIDFDDLQGENSYGSFRAYGTSKLENILFTRELARRLAGTVNCLHPGFVNTRFGDNNASGGFLKALAKGIKVFGIAPEEGAKTIIYLALSPQVASASGGYYYKNKLTEPTVAAQSDADALRLWDVSTKIAGVG